MPRPKKGQTEPAVDRLRGAFWTLLAEKPYADMTVTEILRLTGLNKNAFYYHYGSLDDLAKDAMAKELPYELFFEVTRGFIGGAGDHCAPLLDRNAAACLDRLCLIVGKHGSVHLQEALKQTVRSTWIDLLAIDEEKMEASSSLSLEFLLGGMLSILAYRSEAMPEMTLIELFDSDFMRKAREVFPRIAFEILEADGAISKSSLSRTEIAPFGNGEAR